MALDQQGTETAGTLWLRNDNQYFPWNGLDSVTTAATAASSASENTASYMYSHYNSDLATFTQEQISSIATSVTSRIHVEPNRIYTSNITPASTNDDTYCIRNVFGIDEWVVDYTPVSNDIKVRSPWKQIYVISGTEEVVYLAPRIREFNDYLNRSTIVDDDNFVEAVSLFIDNIKSSNEDCNTTHWIYRPSFVQESNARKYETYRPDEAWIEMLLKKPFTKEETIEPENFDITDEDYYSLLGEMP